MEPGTSQGSRGLCSFTWLAVALVFVGLAQLGLPRNAIADGVEPYVVRGIKVDMTAETAAAARELAVAGAEKEALRRLLTRLTGSDATADRMDAAQLVQGIEVQEERASPVRYVGTLAVRFIPSAIRQALARSGIAFSDTPSLPVLILPLVVDQRGPVLWGVETPWRQAWNTSAPNGAGGLVPIIAPLGDLADVGDVSEADALAADPAALTAIARRYGATSVVVATLAGQARSGSPLSVDLTRVTAGTELPPVRQQIDVPADTDPYAQAVRTVRAFLDADWRQATEVAPGPESSLIALVPVSGLGDWLEIRRRLAVIPQVTGAAVVSLSRRQGELDLRFRGDTERLRAVLLERQLILDDTGAGGWLLALTGTR